MSQELFEDAARQYKALGGDWIDLTPILGEPLLDPGLCDKIRAAKAIGLGRIQLSTNALLLGRNELYRRLFEAGLTWLDISTPGLDRAAYPRIFGVDAFDAVLAGLERLGDFLAHWPGKPTVQLKFRLDRPFAQAREEEGLRRLLPVVEAGLFHINPETVLSQMHNWGGSVVQDRLPPGMTLLPVPDKTACIPCAATAFSATVLPDGRVRTCACRCLHSVWDDLCLGDLHRASLDDILWGAPMAAVIRRMEQGDWPEACAQCSYYAPLPGYAEKNREQAST